MQIRTGPFEHCVLQRGGVVNVTGRTEAAAGKVIAVVTKKGRQLAQVAARVRDQQFALKFNKLPVGGPYVVTFTAGGERLVVKDVLVGDVWICAGQSNMQGLGHLRNADRPQALVRAFYMDDRWAVARDPIHNLHESVDEVHTLINGGRKPESFAPACVGPAVSFGQALLRRTGVPQGLIACAHGGSSMEQWDPQLKSAGTRSLYGAMLRRVERNGGRVAGVVWYQGESEAGVGADVVAYTGRMIELVKAFRRDLRAPRLPVVMAQIGRYLPMRVPANLWNGIQEQQRRMPNVIPHLAVVPTVDLPLDDEIHVGGDGNTRLGGRLAEAVHWLRAGKGSRAPIVLRRVRTAADPLSRWGASTVTVEFGNVVGRLISAGRPSGFTVGHPSDVFAISLEGSRATMRVSLPPLELTTQSMYYGQGTDPYCNITDEAGRPLPVFGPLPLGAARVLTAFAKPRVSELLPGAGKLDGLAYPTNVDSLGWRAKDFRGDFCDVHDEFGSLAPADRMLYFACDLNVAESMQLVALLGYDGPVKLWVDGRELFHDPNGVNPGVIDKKCIRFDVAPGRHPVVVALGWNGGKAWGIYLRFQRLDVKKSRQLPKLL